MLSDLKEKAKPDYSFIKGELFPYQKEGIEFVLFRRAAIIADEMGLGKTIQAIGAAVLKKRIFGFKKTLIVCPATLKSQWKKEIEKFTAEKALILFPACRISGSSSIWRRIIFSLSSITKRFCGTAMPSTGRILISSSWTRRRRSRTMKPKPPRRLSA
jgi:SNF2 family DNA or RNA helicase